jgi:hypothetical protein
MAASGYLWIGTNIGAIMVYHIPHLESVPIVSGKPYLAMDGHVGAVRVLLTMETMETYESSRLGKFLADELFRTSQREEMKEEEDSVSHKQEETTTVPRRKRSASDPVLHILGQGADTPAAHSGQRNRESVADIHYSKQVDPTLERSTTPLLPDPATIFQEESIKEEDEPPDVRILGGREDKSDLIPIEQVEDKGAANGGNGEKAGGEEGSDEDDYNSDELEAKRKFGSGVRGTGKRGMEESILGSVPIGNIEDSVDLSMKDSSDYTIPYVNFSKPDVLYGNITATGMVEDEDPYSNPSELDAVRFGAGKGSVGGESGYSVPSELDYAPGKKEGEYDFPAELQQQQQHDHFDANPYEDPATLAKGMHWRWC